MVCRSLVSGFDGHIVSGTPEGTDMADIDDRPTVRLVTHCRRFWDCGSKGVSGPIR
jgi:hypothetical protein